MAFDNSKYAGTAEHHCMVRVIRGDSPVRGSIARVHGAKPPDDLEAQIFVTTENSLQTTTLMRDSVENVPAHVQIHAYSVEADGDECPVHFYALDEDGAETQARNHEWGRDKVAVPLLIEAVPGADYAGERADPPVPFKYA